MYPIRTKHTERRLCISRGVKIIGHSKGQTRISPRKPQDVFFFSPLSGLKSSFRVYPPSPLFFPSKIRNSTSDKKANMSRQLSMRHLSLLTSVTCKQSQRSFLPSSLSLSYCSLIQEKKKSRFSPRGPPTSCIYTYSLYIYIHIPDTMVEVVARQQCFPFLGTLLLKRPLFSFSLYLFLFPSHPSTILTRYH